MSETPRTDEAESTHLTTPHYHVVGSVFARQLERELAEAKRDAARYQVVRQLNKREFAALVDDCLFRDLRFDDEVDKIGGLK